MKHYKLRTYLVVLAGVSVLVVLSPMLSSGTVSSQGTEPTPTYVEVPLGHLPDDCIPGPEPMTIDPNVGRAVGAYPVWALMSGPKASLIYIDGHPTEVTEYGWPHKFLWRMRNTYSGTVTIRGRNIETQQPVYFQLNDQETPTATLQLQLASSNTFTFPDFPGAIFIPAAGCYTLEAQWDGGYWRINFAAGEITETEWEATATASAP